LSKVFSGLVTASPKYVKSSLDFVKLWTHETTRVFHDRLINNQDRSYFIKAISSFFKNLNVEAK